MRQRKSPSKMPKPRRRRGPSRGPIELTGQLGVSDRRPNTAGRLLPPNDNLREGSERNSRRQGTSLPQLTPLSGDWRHSRVSLESHS
jgi:hypothetical protein